jgi:hypothetical protein
LKKDNRRALLLLFIGIVLCVGACIRDEGKDTFTEPVTDPVTIAEYGRSESRCGDGFCDGPENNSNCPADCLEKDVEDVMPSPSDTSSASGDHPPIYFFYAIHVHGSDENLPYTDPARLNLNPKVAENIIAAVVDIEKVLDKYGVKGTWEVLPAAATGICAFQGDDHIFHQLIAKGHEVGTHAHRIDDIQNSYWALKNDCGITAITTSGFIAQISSYDTEEVQSAMSLSIQASVDLGMTIGTTNLSPGGGRNPFAELCNNQIGLDNDMWSQSGNLMFPWRPDILHQDVCAHSDEGSMLLVDHVSIEWIKLPGQEGVPDVLTDQNFTQLRNWFDGALQYMEEEKPQRIAAWGFVTHITEYAVGSKAEHPLDPEALTALDNFLAYVDSKRMEGKIIYATVSEIADLVAINR